jgi:membrane-bound ClpP family serine protease
MGGIALFMICTALVVLVPVLLQLRMGESRLREVWGYFVFIVGLLLIAAGDTTRGRDHQATFTLVGVVATVVGVIVQARNSGTPGPHRQT